MQLFAEQSPGPQHLPHWSPKGSVDVRMDSSRFAKLPDELLEAVIAYLDPRETVSFGRTSKRGNKLIHEPLVWKRHCMQEYDFWNEQSRERLRSNEHADWHALFRARKVQDVEAAKLFEDLLKSVQMRTSRMEKIAEMGYDVKDYLLRQRDETPDDGEDVLARRWHANAILGLIHRKIAIEKWLRLQQHRMVRLEEVLGAYDLFVLHGRHGDQTDIDAEFDRLANAVRSSDPEFDAWTIRRKAIAVCAYLREQRLIGTSPTESDYHALRNNFLSHALFTSEHTSLPLQTVAIYCAVARRLGINAKPSNFPYHVHAVIESPSDTTLDGASRPRDRELDACNPADVMHLDPWRSSEEIPRSHLTARLLQLGAPSSQHTSHLAATSNLEITLRTSRNIMTSVQLLRDTGGTPENLTYPSLEDAWYAMLWSMLLLGESHHRRRQCLPYLVEHYQSHYPSDLGLIEQHVLPLFPPVDREHNVLLHVIEVARKADALKPAPRPRPKQDEDVVKRKIGQYFRHRRFGYRAMVIGWSERCEANPEWIESQGVNRLPGGQGQPFYNVM